MVLLGCGGAVTVFWLWEEGADVVELRDANIPVCGGGQRRRVVVVGSEEKVGGGDESSCRCGESAVLSVRWQCALCVRTD